MDKELIPLKKEDRTILRKLLQLYYYDTSEFDGADLNKYGEYDYTWLDQYWTDENRWPYLFRVDGKVAGFAFVRFVEGTHFDMSEYFILRKYRNAGLGKYFATELFRAHRGSWYVRVLQNNGPALAFWENVVGEYSSGSFKKNIWDSWEGVVYEFV
ncbi:MAG: GNAT family N-acetyltransferase [Spirochaetales bacterium]|nr:GNAT family N-acetyltransferase [Spirochaetales bacterium]